MQSKRSCDIEKYTKNALSKTSSDPNLKAEAIFDEEIESEGELEKRKSE
jgi:hypothetical protein